MATAATGQRRDAQPEDSDRFLFAYTVYIALQYKLLVLLLLRKSTKEKPWRSHQQQLLQQQQSLTNIHNIHWPLIHLFTHNTFIIFITIFLIVLFSAFNYWQWLLSLLPADPPNQYLYIKSTPPQKQFRSRRQRQSAKGHSHNISTIFFLFSQFSSRHSQDLAHTLPPAPQPPSPPEQTIYANPRNNELFTLPSCGRLFILLARPCCISSCPCCLYNASLSDGHCG